MFSKQPGAFVNMLTSGSLCRLSVKKQKNSGGFKVEESYKMIDYGQFIRTSSYQDLCSLVLRV